MKNIPLSTAKAALAAMNDAAAWISISEQGRGRNEKSWFTSVPSFDRRRRALRSAIARAEASR